jgi:hypothetical protein
MRRLDGVAVLMEPLIPTPAAAHQPAGGAHLIKAASWVANLPHEASIDNLSKAA